MCPVQELFAKFVSVYVQQERPWKCIFIDLNIINKLFILELNNLLRSMVLKLESDLFGCAQCEYSTKFHTTILNHIESKHVITGGFTCPVCPNVCKTRKALKMHKYRKHQV